MAISLALNGASFGGIIGVPLLVAAIGHFGFSGAMTVAAVVMVVVMIPVILIFVGPAAGAAIRQRRGCGRRAVADRRSARGHSAISRFCRYHRRLRWCCSRRSASSFT